MSALLPKAIGNYEGIDIALPATTSRSLPVVDVVVVLDGTKRDW